MITVADHRHLAAIAVEWCLAMGITADQVTMIITADTTMSLAAIIVGYLLDW